jgi:hypothetical protein
MFVTPHEEKYGAPRRFLVAWTAFILVLTTAPYLVDFLLTPKGWSYAWIVPPYPADSYAYRAWAKQAFDGAWLFSLKYTSHPNRPFLFLPFFLFAGRLARVTGADIGLTLLFLKAAGTGLFFWAFGGLLRRLKMTPFQSIAACVFAGIASGAGGVLPLLSEATLTRAWTPTDAWLVDSNTFWSLLWSPVYPFSLALVVLCVRFADEAFGDGDARAAWLSGACICALAVLHPYPIAVLVPLVTALAIVRRPRHAAALWLRFAAAAFPGAAYAAGLSIFHPLIRAHNALGSEESVTIVAALAGLGFPLILAAAGVYAEGKAFARRHWFLLAWAGLSVGLALCPIWLRSKYLFASHLPVCLLAGAAAQSLLGDLRRNARVAALLMIAFPFTQLVHLSETFSEVSANPENGYRVSPGMREALTWLDEHADKSSRVFATAPTSAKVCAFSGDTVFWGHWAQAIDYDEQSDILKAVSSGDDWLPAAERRRRFWGFGVDYLVVDGKWVSVFATGQPAAALLVGAEPVFSNDEVRIYRRPDAGAAALNRSRQASSTAVSPGSPISRR